jgi:phytoene dehydrogenase-like protein
VARTFGKFSIRNSPDVPSGSEAGRPVTGLREFEAAHAVLLDLTAWPAALLAGERLPAAYRRRLERFPHAPSVFKFEYALAAPIPWTAEAYHRAGLSTSAARWMKSPPARAKWRAAGCREARSCCSRSRVVSIPPARPDQHTAWAYCHVPRGSTVDCTAAIEAQIERFATGFQERVLARHTSDPTTLEAGNANLHGGDITGGANDLWHLLARPTLSFTPHRMPARGLYLCSSSTPPGGGMHSLCGYHAARTALSRERR